MANDQDLNSMSPWSCLTWN